MVRFSCDLAIGGKNTHSISGFFNLFHAASPVYTREALRDEITELPGLPDDVNFRQFSGYVPLQENTTKQMFYWFVEADIPDPASAPLVLWTNGGPVSAYDLSGSHVPLRSF